MRSNPLASACHLRQVHLILWYPRQSNNNWRGKEIKPHPRPLPLAVGSKDEPSSELDMPRLTGCHWREARLQKQECCQSSCPAKQIVPVEGVEEIHAETQTWWFLVTRTFFKMLKSSL